jgi:hypothetical protein
MSVFRIVFLIKKNNKGNKHCTAPVYDGAKGQILGEEYLGSGITKTRFLKNLLLFPARAPRLLWMMP